MALTDLEIYWCCLNPREQAIAATCMTAYIGSPGYILQTDYEAAWALQGYETTNKLVVAFNTIYGLVSGTVADPEGDPIPVMFMTGDFWAALVEFSFTTGLSCAAKCKELVFSS